MNEIIDLAQTIAILGLGAGVIFNSLTIRIILKQRDLR